MRGSSRPLVVRGGAFGGLGARRSERPTQKGRGLAAGVLGRHLRLSVLRECKEDTREDEPAYRRGQEAIARMPPLFERGGSQSWVPQRLANERELQ